MSTTSALILGIRLSQDGIAAELYDEDIKWGHAVSKIARQRVVCIGRVIAEQTSVFG